ncbi:MAG: in-like serine protease, partial [Paenibacillus sp.]|nr:in-like serine protease [Paenibacillus sp.]
TQDIVGHGTAVAGNSIYNDIEKSIEERKFVPTNWLFSAKVMYGQQDFHGNMEPIYDPDKLFENQLNEAIRTFLNNAEYKIKVVNISFGNRYEVIGQGNNRQFPLANLLDELAYEYRNVVFVVSAGNQQPSFFYELEQILEDYPKYLVENPDFKIINPATSALSLTVGSIATPPRIFDHRLGEDIWHPIAKDGQPSPFSRTGFEINGMLKPEIVDYGGNLILRKNFGRVIENPGGKMALLSNKPTENLFNFDIGTSFSAPKISNIIGQIANKFPDKSANFLKNLLLQSTEITPVPATGYTASKQDKAKLQMTGYGIPSLNKAIYSLDNRIVLLDEGAIGLNKVKVYSINLPKNFFETSGTKKLSAVLTFDPIVRSTRGDSYLGVQMEFKLFQSVDPEQIVAHYAIMEADNGDENEEDTTPVALKPYEIDLKPGVNIRNKGCHQKGLRQFKTAQMAPPITLVVRCLNKWISNPEYTQNYCISLIVEHSAEIDIYNMVRTEVQQRTRIR